MGMLFLKVPLYFMAFLKDADAVCEITQTYVIRLHCAPVLKKAKTITDVAVADVLLML